MMQLVINHPFSFTGRHMLCHVFSYVCIRLQNGRVPEAVLHMHGYRSTVTILTFHCPHKTVAAC